MIRIWFAFALLLTVNPLFAAQLSQHTAVRVQKAHELSLNQQLPQAIQYLQNTDSSRNYDKAFIARMLGVFYWQNGQIQQAIPQLKKAVSSKLLEDDNAWLTERMLADLYLTEQDYKNALQHYYSLVDSAADVKQSMDLWLRIAQSHYQLEQWLRVIPAADNYLALKPEKQTQPLSLKLGSQLQLKKLNQAIITLNQLIEIEPTKLNWWRQLVSLHMQLKQNRTALDTLALAKLQGLQLSQSDRRLLAQLYANRGIPERAALEIRQLEGSQTNVKLLAEQAHYWQSAKEWQEAINSWNKAAQFDAVYYWQVAQLLLQQRQYQDALDALNMVKDKKYQVALAKTRAFYKLGELEKALIEAKTANNLNPSTQAKEWIEYINRLREKS